MPAKTIKIQIGMKYWERIKKENKRVPIKERLEHEVVYR